MLMTVLYTTVIGSNNTSVTLDGLIPGTNYSITVRAYQDILGPPSSPLNVMFVNISELKSMFLPFILICIS